MKKTLLAIFALAFCALMSPESNAQMFWNKAAQFDTSTVFYFNDASSLNLTGSLTIEMWLNPSDTVTPGGTYSNQKKIINKQNYELTLLHGKPRLLFNGTGKITGKTGIATNKWNHVAVTYDSASGVCAVYINGQLDTSAVNSGDPNSSGNDLYIGKNPSGSSVSNYKGLMDEIRIWNSALPQSEIERNFRTSLGINTGIYKSLVLSVPFQKAESTGSGISIADMSGLFNDANAVNLSAVDLGKRPYETISFNESLELDGNGYVSAPNTTEFSPTSRITIQCWVYPKFHSNYVFILKGPASLSSPKYMIGMTVTGKLYGVLNGNTFITGSTLPLNQWTHVAFQYIQSGQYRFFVNGINTYSGTTASLPISTSSDSLYIGGTASGFKLNGYIDEVRIESSYQSPFDISKYMFVSKDKAIENISAGEVAYNFDGLQFPNTSFGVKLNFRGNARMSNPATVANQPVSPLNRSDEINFEKGFYLKTSDRLIPESGTSGSMTDDSLDIQLDAAINDINLFVATNHAFSNDLEISLIAPNGDIADVCFDVGQLGTNDNITAIFDDQADSSLVSGKYTFVAPRIKPQNSLNSFFAGDNCKGVWRLRINDDNANNTGRLYAWGIQINNASSKTSMLSSNCLIQGFYNASTNSMVRDTVRFYLRNFSSPYLLKDSAKDYLGNIGGAQLAFNNTDTGKYYIQLKHRNSLETWSAVTFSFDPLTQQAEYYFRSDANTAYGSNMILIDSSPLRYAVYNGDINKDGTIDLSDIVSIFNDANNFISGYVITDATGDDFVDLSDITVAFNNSINFVSAITP